MTSSGDRAKVRSTPACFAVARIFELKRRSSTATRTMVPIIIPIAGELDSAPVACHGPFGQRLRRTTTRRDDDNDVRGGSLRGRGRNINGSPRWRRTPAETAGVAGGRIGRIASGLLKTPWLRAIRPILPPAPRGARRRQRM